jgi:hypothetical protein
MTPPRRPGGPPGPETRIGFDPAIASHPGVQEFHRHWLALRRPGRRLPARADLDPTQVPGHLLPSTILLRVHHDANGLDFEYRIVGQALVERLGNVKGRRVREAALLDASASAYANYRAVAESGAAQFLEGRTVIPARPDRPFVISRVHCPLSTDDLTVDWIFSYVAFLPPTASA